MALGIETLIDCPFGEKRRGEAKEEEPVGCCYFEWQLTMKEKKCVIALAWRGGGPAQGPSRA